MIKGDRGRFSERQRTVPCLLNEIVDINEFRPVRKDTKFDVYLDGPA